MRTATIAMACASWASVLRLWPVSNSRTRAASFAGTSTTCSPSARSRCASGRPAPLAPSTAQTRSGHAFAYFTIAAYPARSVANRPWPSLRSRSSTTSIVADSLWGSTPMTTCSTSAPLLHVLLPPALDPTWTARWAVLLRAGQSLLEPRLVTVTGGPQTEREPHQNSRWAAARRAARRSPGPSLAGHRSYGNRLVAASRPRTVLGAGSMVPA